MKYVGVSIVSGGRARNDNKKGFFTYRAGAQHAAR